MLKATSHHIRSCHGKAITGNIFVADPDPGALNRMALKIELFDLALFKTLSKPISPGNEFEIFAIGKGTLCLLFNVDGKQKEDRFEDVLFVSELNITLIRWTIGTSSTLQGRIRQ